MCFITSLRGSDDTTILQATVRLVKKHFEHRYSNTHIDMGLLHVTLLQRILTFRVSCRVYVHLTCSCGYWQQNKLHLCVSFSRFDSLQQCLIIPLKSDTHPLNLEPSKECSCHSIWYTMGMLGQGKSLLSLTV